MTDRNSAKEFSRDAKRSRFQGKEKAAVQSKRRMILGAAGLAVVALGIAVGVPLMLGDGGPDETLSTPSSPSSPPVSSSSASSAASSTSYASATRGHAPYPLLEADPSGAVRLPVGTFDDYVAHYYTYVHDDQPIEFFVLKSQDGVVRAAFNACDICYDALKGYNQDGEVMVCNNCGRRFPADQINIVQGGCNPSPLDRTVEGSDLVLSVDDIIGGAGYF